MAMLYSYTGPVMQFNQCIANNWSATTYAVSEAKARSNLTYRFKKEYNKAPNAKIILPNRIIAEG